MKRLKLIASFMILCLLGLSVVLFPPLNAQQTTEIIFKPACVIEELPELLAFTINASLRGEKRKVLFIFNNENHSLIKHFTLYTSEETFFLDKLSFPDSSYKFQLALDMGSFYELSDSYLLQLHKKKPSLWLSDKTVTENNWIVSQTKISIRVAADEFLRKMSIQLNKKTIPMQNYGSSWLYEGFLPLNPGTNHLIVKGENLHGAIETLPLTIIYQIQRPTRKIHSILYHDVAYKDSSMSISPELFEKHISYLVDRAYYFVSSEQLEQYLYAGLALPEKSVFVSFDDGCKGVLDYALPILQKYQAHASLYVTTSFIGKDGFITWEDLKILADSGYFSIGSHSYQLHHQYWIPETQTMYLPIQQNIGETFEQYEQRLLNDFKHSKSEIEKNIQQEISSFAYPFGVHTRTARKMLKTAGYRMALASNNRYRTSIVPSDEPFSLMRYTILSHVPPHEIILEEK
jgi:peptidoglycan/xylan/chitin deacetylase (PgdA/CDA1 family)